MTTRQDLGGNMRAPHLSILSLKRRRDYLERILGTRTHSPKSGRYFQEELDSLNWAIPVLEQAIDVANNLDPTAFANLVSGFEKFNRRS